MVASAIRRGWLASVAQEDRDALSARFEHAMLARMAADPNDRNHRARHAEVAVVLAQLQSMCKAASVLQYAWAGEFTGQTTGRPRTRWYVSDFPNRIDANELRRRMIAEGMDPSRAEAIEVRPADSPDTPAAPDAPAWTGERIALAVDTDARYAWRLWLVCPKCQCNRTHLYPVRGKLPPGGTRIVCRECAGITHGPKCGPRDPGDGRS